MSDSPQTLGEHIRKVRLERGLSQQELVRLFKTSKDLLTCWETGRRQPQVHWYPKILTFLLYNPFQHGIESISEQLLHVRLCLGYSVKKFASILNIDTGTLSRWEKGRGQITHAAMNLVNAYWCNLSDYLKNKPL